MTSFINSLTSIDKSPIVIDIGHVYTKCGFAGSSSPTFIIPTSFTVGEKTLSVFENTSDVMTLLDDRLGEFIRLIYSEYLITNCYNRRVIIIESVITPTRIRHLLANILLKQLGALSLVFIPSHLCAIYTLGRSTALILDVGYKETQIMPIGEGVPLANQFDSLPYASQLVHKQIQLLLKQHAVIIQAGKKKAFRNANIKLPENILEDIKIRCCFVSPFLRAQKFAENQSTFKEIASIDYTFNTDTIIRIPGVVREFSYEVLFQQDIDGKSIVTLILDTLLHSSIDLRRQLADNILIIGGTAIIPGFLHRFHAELKHLANVSTYVNRLTVKEFHFHSPPAQLNYAAWLGGSIFGATDTLELQSIKRNAYLENGILPDWFTGEQVA